MNQTGSIGLPNSSRHLTAILGSGYAISKTVNLFFQEVTGGKHFYVRELQWLKRDLNLCVHSCHGFVLSVGMGERVCKCVGVCVTGLWVGLNGCLPGSGWKYVSFSYVFCTQAKVKFRLDYSGLF